MLNGRGLQESLIRKYWGLDVGSRERERELGKRVGEGVRGVGMGGMSMRGSERGCVCVGVCVWVWVGVCVCGGGGGRVRYRGFVIIFILIIIMHRCVDSVTNYPCAGILETRQPNVVLVKWKQHKRLITDIKYKKHT